MSDIELDLEDITENLFADFVNNYELDPEGSINDMLFEFFAEGFIAALNMAEEYGENDGSEEEEEDSSGDHEET
jgi:hypothetical protein